MCGASALFCVFVFVTTLFVSFLNKHDYRKLKLLLNTGTISLCTSISMTWYKKTLQDLNTRNISENCFQFLSKIANCLSINCWLHSVEPNYTILNIPQFVIPQSPALPGAVQKTRDGPSSMEVGLTKSQHLNLPGSAMQKCFYGKLMSPGSLKHFTLLAPDRIFSLYGIKRANPVWSINYAPIPPAACHFQMHPVQTGRPVSNTIFTPLRLPICFQWKLFAIGCLEMLWLMCTFVCDTDVTYVEVKHIVQCNSDTAIVAAQHSLYIYISVRVFLAIYFGSFSGNFDCIVCLIVAWFAWVGLIFIDQL